MVSLEYCVLRGSLSKKFDTMEKLIEKYSVQMLGGGPPPRYIYISI